MDTSQAAAHFGTAGRSAVERATAKARRRTSEQVLRKLTTRSDDGTVRIIDQHGSLCASLLARAHGQSPNADAIAAYLGRGDNAVDALADRAAAYADLAESDCAALQEAVRAGRVPA